jgi:hypothetical protein
LPNPLRGLCLWTESYFFTTHFPLNITLLGLYYMIIARKDLPE